MTMHKPKWFSSKTVMVSTAPSCGLTKGGRLLPMVDPETGKRVQVADPETGELIDAINDRLLEDMRSLSVGEETDTLRFIDASLVSTGTAVPAYYDRRYEESFNDAMESDPRV